MSTDEEKFKIKLKKCKSLQDYRDLVKEYNIKEEGFTAESRERMLLKVVRNRRHIYKIYPSPSNRIYHLHKLPH